MSLSASAMLMHCHHLPMECQSTPILASFVLLPRFLLIYQVIGLDTRRASIAWVIFLLLLFSMVNSTGFDSRMIISLSTLIRELKQATCVCTCIVVSCSLLNLILAGVRMSRVDPHHRWARECCLIGNCSWRIVCCIEIWTDRHCDSETCAACLAMIKKRVWPCRTQAKALIHGKV